MVQTKMLIDKIKNFDVSNLGIYKVKLLRLLYPRYGLSPDDIILATFPKSGTTWLRFIFANIISLTELDGQVVDYKLLNEELNTAFNPNWKPNIEYSCLPLIRPTHNKFNERVFGDNRSIYLYRNPKDVMVSNYHNHKSFIKNPFEGTFKELLNDENFGLESWCKHVNSWMDNFTINISYEKMRRDTYQSIKSILQELNIDHIEDDIIQEAIRRSDFNIIKKLEKERGLDKITKKKHGDNFQSARKGKINEAKVYFDEKDEIYFNKILTKYNLLDFYKSEYK